VPVPPGAFVQVQFRRLMPGTRAKNFWRRWKESNFHASVYETDALANLSYIAISELWSGREAAPLRNSTLPSWGSQRSAPGMSHAPRKVLVTGGGLEPPTFCL
jgi:hypothetical protein